MLYFHEVTDTATDLSYRINLCQIVQYVEEDDYAAVWMKDGMEPLIVSDVEWSEIRPILATIQEETKRQLRL
jgi:hypothetical protein